jgi:hypothetical protein
MGKLTTKACFRLLAIEKKYHALLSDQQGAGNGCPNCEKEKQDSTPLSQVIMENEKKHALETPVPKIGPSISNPLEGTPALQSEATVSKKTEGSSRKTKVDWFYIGDA